VDVVLIGGSLDNTFIYMENSKMNLTDIQGVTAIVVACSTVIVAFINVRTGQRITKIETILTFLPCYKEMQIGKTCPREELPIVPHQNENAGEPLTGPALPA
jgi:hypothetical protein